MDGASGGPPAPSNFEVFGALALSVFLFFVALGVSQHCTRWYYAEKRRLEKLEAYGELDQSATEDSGGPPKVPPHPKRIKKSQILRQSSCPFASWVQTKPKTS